MSPENSANKSDVSLDQLRVPPPAQGEDALDEPPSSMDLANEGDAAEIEIRTTFRRMMMGLRRLPRRERAQALRAAREWRSFALNALHEKRQRDRHARYMQRRRNQMPGPH